MRDHTQVSRQAASTRWRRTNCPPTVVSSKKPGPWFQVKQTFRVKPYGKKQRAFSTDVFATREEAEAYAPAFRLAVEDCTWRKRRRAPVAEPPEEEEALGAEEERARAHQHASTRCGRPYPPRGGSWALQTYARAMELASKRQRCEQNVEREEGEAAAPPAAPPPAEEELVAFCPEVERRVTRLCEKQRLENAAGALRELSAVAQSPLATAATECVIRGECVDCGGYFIFPNLRLATGECVVFKMGSGFYCLFPGEVNHCTGEHNHPSHFSVVSQLPVKLIDAADVDMVRRGVLHALAKDVQGWTTAGGSPPIEEVTYDPPQENDSSRHYTVQFNVDTGEHDLLLVKVNGEGGGESLPQRLGRARVFDSPVRLRIKEDGKPERYIVYGNSADHPLDFTTESRSKVAAHFVNVLNWFPRSFHRVSKSFANDEQRMRMAGVRRAPWAAHQTGYAVGNYKDMPEKLYHADAQPLWAMLNRIFELELPNAFAAQADAISKVQVAESTRRLRVGDIGNVERDAVINVGLSDAYHSPDHRDNDIGMTLALAIKCPGCV